MSPAKRRRVLKAAIPADLINKIYKAEGWTRGGDFTVRRCKTLYDFSVDHRAGKYVATPKDTA
jgi:hypothetical protein